MSTVVFIMSFQFFLGPQGKRARTDGNSGRDVRPDALLAWLSKQVEPYSEVGVKPVTDMTTSFQVLIFGNCKS